MTAFKRKIKPDKRQIHPPIWHRVCPFCRTVYNVLKVRCPNCRK